MSKLVRNREVLGESLGPETGRLFFHGFRLFSYSPFVVPISPIIRIPAMVPISPLEYLS